MPVPDAPKARHDLVRQRDSLTNETSTSLGELLTLLHDAGRGLKTFEGEFRDLVRLPPSNVVVAERDGPRGPGIKLRPQGAGLFPRVQELHRRIWFESPNRLRVDVLRGGETVLFGVRDGARWWRWDRIEGSSRDGPRDQTLPRILDPTLLVPARLIAFLDLKPAGRGYRLGRDVLLARGIPRDRAHQTGTVHEFDFDARQGTVLWRATRQDSQYVQSTEAVSVCFNGPIEPQRFEFTPPR